MLREAPRVPLPPQTSSDASSPQASMMAGVGHRTASLC